MKPLLLTLSALLCKLDNWHKRKIQVFLCDLNAHQTKWYIKDFGINTATIKKCKCGKISESSWNYETGFLKKTQ